jgi:hypothetical protein
LKRASQPYRDIERFLAAEKVMTYIVGPGLLPVVTAVSKDIMGKKVLVTRRVAAKDNDKGVIGHLEGFGVRIMMYFDEATGDTIACTGYCRSGDFPARAERPSCDSIGNFSRR